MMYRIFQLNRKSPNYHAKSFTSLRMLERLGLSIDLNDYVEVYSEEVDDTTNDLEKIFVKFNMNHPDDFTGHSLSVADIVEFNNEKFFCDSFGFKKIV